jgi:hypothetical protein
MNTDKMMMAELADLQPEEIVDVRLELEMLRNKGLLVDLNISGTGIFQTRAKWFELGISKEELRTDWFTAGSKNLIPDQQIKRLKSVQARMRQCLTKYSYNIAGFRPYRWIPFTAYKAFKARFEELRKEFLAIKADILANYNQYSLDLVTTYEDIAKESFKKNAEDKGVNYISLDGRNYDKDDYVQRVIDGAQASFPSRAKVASRLQADYTTGALHLGNTGNQTVSLAEQVEAKAKAEKAKLELSKAEIEIEAMRQAELEHARQALQEMSSPFEEVFEEMRYQMAESAESILTSVKKNGFLKGKVKEKGQGLLDWFDLMSAHTDDELRGKLIDLRTAINIPTDKPVNKKHHYEKVVEALEDITELAKVEAEEIGRADRFALLEL